MSKPDRTTERLEMVARQVAARGVRDPRVLQAMREVPREEFVAPEFVAQAYEDGALPIDAGQTISQPYIVALMLEAAEIRPGDRVLEVGAGSGYATALLHRLAAEVFAVERHASLVEAARERLQRVGAAGVQLAHADGTLGWPEHAPFDAIIVSAGGAAVPSPLMEQLAVGGRLVIPVGDGPEHQRLLALRRENGHRFSRRDLGPVRFVPLVPSQD